MEIRILLHARFATQFRKLFNLTKVKNFILRVNLFVGLLIYLSLLAKSYQIVISRNYNFLFCENKLV